MKYSILGKSPDIFKRKIGIYKGVCILIVVITLCLNICFTILRTENNHIYMLIANIFADSVCSCFLIWFISLKILEPMRLYNLMGKTPRYVTGFVEYVSDVTTRYMGIDCYEVVIEDVTVFLPANTLSLKVNEKAIISEVSGIIVEVEYETAHTV